MGLHKQRRAVRVDAGGEEPRGCVDGALPQRSRVVFDRNGVWIDDADEVLRVLLGGTTRDGAEVVVDVDVAGRLYTAEDPGDRAIVGGWLGFRGGRACSRADLR